MRHVRSHRDRRPRHDRLAQAFCSALLADAALLYALSADAPQTLLLTLGGLLAGWGIPTGKTTSSRTYVYGGIVVLVATVADVQFFPVEAERFFLLPAHVYAPLLLYTGVALLVPVPRSGHYTAIMTIGLVVLTLAGNTIGLPQTNVRFAIANPLLRQYMTVYALGVAVAIIAMAYLSPRIVRHSQHWQPSRGRRLWLRHFLVLFCLFGVAALVMGGRVFIQQCEPFMGRLLSFIAAQSGARGQHVVFGRDVDLWRTLPYSSYRDPTPVVRVFSPDMPGYMRGRAFTTYRNGHWTQDRQTRVLPRSWPSGKQVFTVFSRSLAPEASAAPGPRMVILPAARHATSVLLAPAQAYEFEMVAERLRSDLDGALFHHGWKQDSGCQLRTRKGEDAYPRPRVDARSHARYTQLPEQLTPRLAAWNREMGLDGTLDAADAWRIEETVEFLRDRCSYALGVGLRSAESDPIVQFLDERRQGHCELFAAAAALLLRQQGVPTRYVTGFVCIEWMGGSSWLARLRDAHAWVEAFDRQQGVWKRVEATPAEGIPTPSKVPRWLRAARQYPVIAWQWIQYHISRGDFAQAVAQVLGRASRRVWRFARTPAGWNVLITIGLLLLGARMLRRRQKHRQRLPFDHEMGAVRRRLLKTLQQAGINRYENETLRELVGRACTVVGRDSSRQINRVAEQYQRLRFCPGSRSKERVADLDQKSRSLRRLVARGGLRKHFAAGVDDETDGVSPE